MESRTSFSMPSPRICNQSVPGWPWAIGLKLPKYSSRRNFRDVAGQISMPSAPVFTQLGGEANRLTSGHDEDRAAKMLGQRQQFEAAAFPTSQALRVRFAGLQQPDSLAPFWGCWGTCKVTLLGQSLALPVGGG
jgi:hypothetical protein